MARNTSCMDAAWPRISGPGTAVSATSSWRRLSSMARRIRSTAWSTSNGLGRYSKAPPWKAATALSKSEYAVMIMTGRLGWRSLIFCSSSSPEPPGMRMSLTTTCGAEELSALSASCAEENILKLMSSRVRVFSNTQRMDRSSSMIQTGFMVSIQGPPGGSPSSAARPQRQDDGETGPSRFALELDGALVLADDVLGQRQAQSGSTFAARYQREEDLVA